MAHQDTGKDIFYNSMEMLTAESATGWNALFDEVKAKGHRNHFVESEQLKKEAMIAAGLSQEKFDQAVAIDEYQKRYPLPYVTACIKYQLNIGDMVVIDDRQDNVTAAILAEADGIVYKKETGIAGVRQQLIEKNIL